ncbi:MAG: hypothetical protein ABSA91_17185 [Acidimicrobiales bacterium]|jgi:hypothetical protein
MNDMIWSFSPWLVFLTVNRFASLYWAIAAGGVAAVVVLARAVSRHKVHLFDGVSVAYFAVIGAFLAITQPGNIATWARYAQAGSHGTLTAIVFASILIGHPFTESYARERVPETAWKRPEFHAVNRKMSAIFGLAFLIGTLSMITAGSAGSPQFLLRIAIPFGALLGAFTLVQRQTSAANPSPVPAHS